MDCYGAGVLASRDQSPVVALDSMLSIEEAIEDRLENAGGAVEVTEMGVKVFRAKRRGRRKKAEPVQASHEGGPKDEDSSMKKRGRGRPRKNSGKIDVEQELTEGLERRKRLNKAQAGTTDFVNTTAFKVSRELRDRAAWPDKEDR